MLEPWILQLVPLPQFEVPVSVSVELPASDKVPLSPLLQISVPIETADAESIERTPPLRSAFGIVHPAGVLRSASVPPVIDTVPDEPVTVAPPETSIVPLGILSVCELRLSVPLAPVMLVVPLDGLLRVAVLATDTGPENATTEFESTSIADEPVRATVVAVSDVTVPPLVTTSVPIDAVPPLPNAREVEAPVIEMTEVDEAAV